MEIKKLENENLIKYFEFIKQLGNLLLSYLNNRLVFKQKLENLQVTVHLSNTKTEAFLLTKDIQYSLLLVVNPKNNEQLIKFIIAHELGHLLFAPINKLRTSGYCSTDNSFDVTSVRRTSNGSEEYGNALEEMLCDYIALTLLDKSYNGKYNREELLRIAYSEERSFHLKENFYLTQSIINLFENCPNKTAEKYKFDSYTEHSDGSVSPDNLLMYTATTNTLNLFVNQYDTIMGKGSWKRFNQTFESFVSNNLDTESRNIIEIEMKRFSMIEKI